MTTRLFDLGQVGVSPGALDALQAEWDRIPAWAREGAIQGPEAVAFAFLGQHARGDWGELASDPEACQENERGLQEGDRIFSRYVLPLTGLVVLVITEADRSATMILLPEEY